jgi:hypothetical protein
LIWFWKLGLILKMWYDLKIGYEFENWVWFCKLGLILKIGYDFLKRVGGGGEGGGGGGGEGDL